MVWQFEKIANTASVSMISRLMDYFWQTDGEIPQRRGPPRPRARRVTRRAIGPKPTAPAKATAWDRVTTEIDRYLAMPKAHEQVLRRGR